MLTILERSCCTYLFFSHLLKPLQKLDRILQKISIPPEIFKQFSYPPFFCSKNLRSPPKILCPPPVGYIMNAALAEVSYLVFCISWSFHGCLTCSLIKTAMKILRKMRTLLVYFHSFCISVIPTSNLMSNKLLSIAVSFLLLFFLYFLPTEVATCSPRLPNF